MHLHDLLGWPGPMTGRQFEAWQAYLTRQENEPDRQCWYLMQVAAEIRLIRHSLSKDAPPVKLSDLKLKFVRGEQARPREMDPKVVEATFLARMGLVGKAREEAVERGKGGPPKRTPGMRGPLVAPPAGGAKPPAADGRTWAELNALRHKGG